MQELDKAWKMLDATHEDIKKDKETIRMLKEEITSLNKKIEQQSVILTDQDHMWAFCLPPHTLNKCWCY